MDSIEKAILEYLEAQSDDWTWVFGEKLMNKHTTITLFKKDKKFRKLVRNEVEKLAVDMFMKAAKRRTRKKGK